MSKKTTPAAASQSLVALHVNAAELAEIRGLIEHSIQMDGIGKDATGIELAELAEKFTPAFLRKMNARQVARLKAAGKDTWTEDPQEQSDRLQLTAGIVRKLVAVECGDAVRSNAPAAATGSAQVPAPTADDHLETFSIKLPREITRWLRADAEEEGKTPEQYIAEAAGEACGCTIESSVFPGGVQERWKELAVEANGAKGDGRTA